MIGIYKITSKIDSTIFYIGKSNNIQRRFKEHIQKTYQQSRIPFDDYINKDNQNDFNFDILEECSLNELNSKEKYWVDKFDAKNFCNKFDGGLNDVVGENNPNAILNENDIIKIRLAYNSHKSQKEVYQEYKEKISFLYFQNIWQGRVWSHIMPEVYTEENKKYYIYYNSIGAKNNSAKFSNNEVIKIRNRYITETAKEIYADYKDRISFQGFQAILWGRSYKNLPIYNKKEKTWENNI